MYTTLTAIWAATRPTSSMAASVRFVPLALTYFSQYSSYSQSEYSQPTATIFTTAALKDDGSANVALSGIDDEIATFTPGQEVSVRSNEELDLNLSSNTVCFEWHVLSMTTNKLRLGMWCGGITTFDPDQPSGGGPFQTWISSNGDYAGFGAAGGSAPFSFTSGDVIGCLISETADAVFFKNGTPITLPEPVFSGNTNSFFAMAGQSI